MKDALRFVLRRRVARCARDAAGRILGAAFAASFACALASPHAGARDAEPLPVATATSGIDVGGDIVRHAHLSLDDLAKLPHVHLHASAHGVEGEFDGVPLIEILKAAGAPTGEALRGPALALYVVVGAADRYRAVFALGELDPSTGNRQAILADRKDGKPLDDKEGPLRVIVPDDRRPARWVRQVTSIELRRAPVE